MELEQRPVGMSASEPGERCSPIMDPGRHTFKGFSEMKNPGSSLVGQVADLPHTPTGRRFFIFLRQSHIKFSTSRRSPFIMERGSRRSRLRKAPSFTGTN